MIFIISRIRLVLKHIIYTVIHVYTYNMKKNIEAIKKFVNRD